MIQSDLVFFCKDLKRLYSLAGVDNKPTVFLFNDTQALDESFLEDIGNILSSGEVPNLYKPEEFEEVCEESFPFEFWRGRLDEAGMIITRVV